jgi:hypothetical protein
MSRKTGVIERNQKKGERYHWRLTMDGIGYVKGAHLTSAQAKQIDAMDSPRLLALTTTLMQRYRASGPQAGVLIRREVQHGLTHRNGGTP